MRSSLRIRRYAQIVQDAFIQVLSQSLRPVYLNFVTIFNLVSIWVEVGHATLNRWVVKYSPIVASQALRQKSRTSSPWHIDEAYIKVKGKWVHYRAVDKHEKT